MTPSPPKDTPPPDDAPPPVVGINLASTVAGGTGPAFAVGTHRAGTTAQVAKRPRTPTKTAPRHRSNRRATKRPASKDFEPPRRKHEVRPTYPESYRALRIEGAVTVEIQIETDGRVSRVELLSPSKHDELNESARQAALTEKFVPARSGGRAVRHKIRFTYHFRLNG